MGFALVKLGLHLSLATRYGQHRDEFYFQDCAHNLAFGYVDHAPLTPWLLWLTESLLGDSLLALRLPAAIAGAVGLYLAGCLVARFGGGAIASALCCLALLLAPAYLRMGVMLNIVVLEPVFWTAAVLLFLRALELPGTRRYLELGALLGLALLNKHTTVIWGVGLVIAVLATPCRAILTTRGPWLAALTALVVFAPNLIWQVANDFATLEFIQNMREGTLASIPRTLFALGQLLYIGPLAIPLWSLGLWSLLRDARPERRLLGIQFVAMFGLLFLSHAKPYYLSAAYPVLLAAGATRAERSWPAWVQAVVAGLLLVTGVGLSLVTLPILPLDTVDRGIDRLLGGIVPAEALTHDMHDEFGWRDLAITAAAATATLSPAERADAVIVGANYGIASSLRHFRDEYDLPPAYSGHMTHYLWGPPRQTPSAIVMIGLTPEEIAAVCRSAELFTRFEHPIAQQSGVLVHICREPTDLRANWPKLKRYYHGEYRGAPAAELVPE